MAAGALSAVVTYVRHRARDCNPPDPECPLAPDPTYQRCVTPHQGPAAPEFAQGKPHPEIFLTAAKELGLGPRECFVVEDAAAGVEAAKAGQDGGARRREPRFKAGAVRAADGAAGRAPAHRRWPSPSRARRAWAGPLRCSLWLATGPGDFRLSRLATGLGPLNPLTRLAGNGTSYTASCPGRLKRAAPSISKEC